MVITKSHISSGIHYDPIDYVGRKTIAGFLQFEAPMKCVEGFEIGAAFFSAYSAESVFMMMSSPQPKRHAYSGVSCRALRLTCFAAGFAIAFLAEESAIAQNREPEAVLVSCLCSLSTLFPTFS